MTAYGERHTHIVGRPDIKIAAGDKVVAPLLWDEPVDVAMVTKPGTVMVVSPEHHFTVIPIIEVFEKV